MLACIAPDEQWRFPVELSDIAVVAQHATMAIEDAGFCTHPGIDAAAVARAAWQNLWSWRVVSGASTITMQICRMMDNRPRGIGAKVAEMFRALQLERLWTKDQILAFYLNIAPYGGNLRGIEAAARYYFGKSAAELSLAEAALLAGIPQSPERLRPDRHPMRANRRRDYVLQRMVATGMIDSATARQAMAPSGAADTTTQPGRPQTADCRNDWRRFTIRAHDTHAGWMALERRPAGGRTMLDLTIQRDVQQLADRHAECLPTGTQVAVVVIEIESAGLTAMVGGLSDGHPATAQVNGATARRSPGSALKPFVYAAAFESGRLAPHTRLDDAPIERDGWTPGNFDHAFHGEVSAADALRRSLNVPAILAAERAGLARCLGVMEAAGVVLPAGARTRGGYAVVTGALEVSLLDLTNAYATIGRGGVRRDVRVFDDDPVCDARALLPTTCTALDDILSTVERASHGWTAADSDGPAWCMWKTGTSSARRDAVAVGHNRRFAVGAWVGRFDGAGDVAYTGTAAAEPLLLRLFNLQALRSREPIGHSVATLAATGIGSEPVHDSRKAAALAIISPRAGAIYVAVNGVARVPIQVSINDALCWYLNGQAFPIERPMLELAPGGHKLTCVDAAGRVASAAFTVR